MKKKKCPQCKNFILITAPTCQFCGRPNKFVTNNYVKKKWNKQYENDKLNKNKLVIPPNYLLIIIIITLLIISLVI